MAPRPEKNVQFDASPQQNMRKRLAPESSSHTSLNKAVSNTVTDVRVLPSPVNGLKKEKVKISSSCSPDDVRVADGVLIKKVKKRKTEGELEGTHRRPEMLASLKEEERPRSLKQSAVASPKSSLQPTSLPGVEQSS